MADERLGSSAIASGGNMSHPLLSVRGVGKSFQNTVALDGVDLDLNAGEIVALVGANGAGKSTLVKIICGVYRQDRGELFIEGSPVVINDVAAASRAGIAVVHQELTNIPALTGAENLMLGREPTRNGFIDLGALNREAHVIAERFGVTVDLSRECGELELGQRKILEIAKALSGHPKMLVLDEPTAALSIGESQKLFAFLQSLKVEKLAILLISHHIREVFEQCDRVAILKDGRKVFDGPVEKLQPPELVRLMVGRTIEETDWTSHARAGSETLNLRDLTVSHLDVRDLVVHSGEIVGVAGVLGAGQTELIERIAGVRIPTREGGPVLVNGLTHLPRDVNEAVGSNIYLVADNRLRNSIFPGLTVEENLLTSSLKQTSRLGFMNKGLIGEIARKIIAKLSVKCSSPDQEVMQLSGGNQQKMAFGRWVARMEWTKGAHAPLFLLDNPTEGVDVGSKAELYALITEFARQGGSVLICSSEFAELQKLCERIYIICDGVLERQILRAEFSEERLLLEVSSGLEVEYNER